jgi:hypothetical protein
VTASSGAEENDQQREAEGYNNSIYLMVSVPYLALGVFGFFVYRGMRKKAPAQAAAETSPADGGAPPA